MGNAGVPCARSKRLRRVPHVRALRRRMRKDCWVAETMGARSLPVRPFLSTGSFVPLLSARLHGRIGTGTEKLDFENGPTLAALRALSTQPALPCAAAQPDTLTLD